MEIYLTFDDGIEPGTEDVLQVLDEMEVRATFFLIGAHLDIGFKRGSKSLLDKLRIIYEKHAIGNHSYSHANHFYSEYYKNNGVKIDIYGNRRSIVDDFENGKNVINKYLKFIDHTIDENKPFPLAKKQKIALARFPGRNSSYFGSHLYNVSKFLYQYCESDTLVYAKELFEKGYNIFGWNTEWDMTFELSQKERLLMSEQSGVGQRAFPEDTDFHQNFDMLDTENLSFDRAVEDWSTVYDKVLNSAIHKKTILLMHDRAFRKEGKTNRGNKKSNSAEQLRKLITKLKLIEDVKFRSLDEFTNEIS